LNTYFIKNAAATIEKEQFINNSDRQKQSYAILDYYCVLLMQLQKGFLF